MIATFAGTIIASPESQCVSYSAQHRDIHRRAVEAARHAVLGMRDTNEIGDDAFHQLEEELDWIEMAGGGREGAEAQE